MHLNYKASPKPWDTSLAQIGKKFYTNFKFYLPMVLPQIGAIWSKKKKKISLDNKHILKFHKTKVRNHRC